MDYPRCKASSSQAVSHTISIEGFSIRKTHIIETTCNILSYAVIQLMVHTRAYAYSVTLLTLYIYIYVYIYIYISTHWRRTREYPRLSYTRVPMCSTRAWYIPMRVFVCTCVLWVRVRVLLCVTYLFFSFIRTGIRSGNVKFNVGKKKKKKRTLKKIFENLFLGALDRFRVYEVNFGNFFFFFCFLSLSLSLSLSSRRIFFFFSFFSRKQIVPERLFYFFIFFFRKRPSNTKNLTKKKKQLESVRLSRRNKEHLRISIIFFFFFFFFFFTNYSFLFSYRETRTRIHLDFRSNDLLFFPFLFFFLFVFFLFLFFLIPCPNTIDCSSVDPLTYSRTYAHIYIYICIYIYIFFLYIVYIQFIRVFYVCKNS